MAINLNISRRFKAKALVCLFLTMNCQVACADISDDEDKLRYEWVFQRSFLKFHKRNGRFPRNWIELGVQDSCGWYDPSGRKNLPKASEAIVWTPEGCQLSYKLVFSGPNRFRVVALAKGHVVSVYENYRATYFKTPYHNHEPPEAPEGAVY